MKVVLAYSGGLDTSVIVKWIKDRFNAEVVTFAANVGQGEELEGLAERRRPQGLPRTTPWICRTNSFPTSSSR